MPHPIMFDDDDPRLHRIREIALALPDAAEKISHGHPAFFTTKVFAYYGGSQKTDSEWLRHEHSLLVLPDPTERESLVQDPRCYIPAYLGAYGWIGLQLPPASAANKHWAEVAELIEDSYRSTAGVKRVRALDAQRADAAPSARPPGRTTRSTAPRR